MNCQNLFSGKNMKNISKFRLLNFLFRVLLNFWALDIQYQDKSKFWEKTFECFYYYSENQMWVLIRITLARGLM